MALPLVGTAAHPTPAPPEDQSAWARDLDLGAARGEGDVERVSRGKTRARMAHVPAGVGHDAVAAGEDLRGIEVPERGAQRREAQRLALGCAGERGAQFLARPLEALALPLDALVGGEQPPARRIEPLHANF